MMKQMRENTKIILWIVVIAFVVTIFAVWGLDLQTGGLGPQANVIGKVNGTEVTPQQYQTVYNQISAQYRASAPDGSLSLTQQEQIREDAWNTIVRQLLTTEQIRRLQIGVSDEEIVTYLRTSPPNEIRQYFVDENGQFDFAAYQAALNNPEADWTAVEQLARERIPLIKLNQYLISQVHVSEYETRRLFEEQNTRMVVNYVSFPISSADVPESNPTDEQIKTYYDDHTDDFARTETALVEYVRIPIAPTERDKDDLVYTINHITGRIEAGDDFADLARTYSESHTAPVGGETGFLGRAARDSLVMDAVASMKIGDVSQRIDVTDGAYVVKLLEKKTEDGNELFRFQEIFIELTAGSVTRDSLSTLAEDVQTAAAADGDLNAAATAHGLTTEQTPPFAKGSFVAGMGFVPSVSRFAFNSEPDAISRVLSDEKNFFICRVVERKPATIQPVEDVREIIVTKLTLERRKEEVLRKAKAFHRTAAAPRISLHESSEQYGYTVARTDTFTVPEPVAGNPGFSAFAYAALALDDGAKSPPVESGDAYFVLEFVYRSEFDRELYVSQVQALRDRLFNQKAQQYIAYWFEKLEEESEIVDLRGAY